MTACAGEMLDALVITGGQALAGGHRRTLEAFAHNVLTAADADAAVAEVQRGNPDLVIIDETVTAVDSLSLLRRLRGCNADVPVVVVVEHAKVEQAVRLVRAGAYDYFAGPLDEEHLARLVHGMRAERARNTSNQERFFCPECPPDVEIVGRSEGIVRTLEMIRIVSESRCNPVLILGETGTGKELAARAVHAWRCGSADKFVAINCAALTANLLESELFGHVKGSFTGADRDKRGLFELAGDGTILLDEISEMPERLQAKLLRVLQERTFRKVGGTKELSCLATVVASSNRDLMDEVKKGKFRKDLYYRLAVFPITVPPLRSPRRRRDISLLAEYFVSRSGVSIGTGAEVVNAAAKKHLAAHNWPGNVRELRNVIERALILSKSTVIMPEHLLIEGMGEAERLPAADNAASGRAKDLSLETAEREFILRALQETGWQRTRAAALLGISRATLHVKLKRYGIQPPGISGSSTSEGDARATARTR